MGIGKDKQRAQQARAVTPLSPLLSPLYFKEHCMGLVNKILSLLKRKRVKQVGSLYTSMILGMLIGVIASIVNTRFLGPKLYGDFKFLIQMYNFVVMFLTVGIFFSGSRLLAREESKERAPGIKGAMLVYAAAISLLMMVGVFAFSFFEERIFDNDLGTVIRLFSPLLFVFPFKLCMEGMLIGSNEIYKLSVFRLFPKVFYVLTALSVHFTIGFGLKAALLLQLCAFGIIVGITIFLLKPEFKKVKEHWRYIRSENRSYGFPVYISHLANTATMRVAAFSIAYFIDTTNFGYYALALTVTQPLSMIPRVVGTTFFKEFANRPAIPMKVTLTTVSLSVGALTAFMLIIKTLFFIVYTRDFSPALPIVYVFAVASIIQGFADYVNRFLGAHGRGKDMRNSAFLVAASNIIGYTVLVKLLFLWGAVITRAASSVIYLVTMIFYYQRMRRGGGEVKDNNGNGNGPVEPLDGFKE